MEPYFSRRELTDAADRLRRASGLLTWLASSDAGAAGADAPVGVALPEPWQAWLESHLETIPGDLRPPLGGERIQSILLAAAFPSPEPEGSGRVRLKPERLKQAETQLLHGSVSMPLSMVGWEHRKHYPPFGIIDRLLEPPAARDATCLWALAWWAASVVRSGRPSSQFAYLWRSVGKHLSGRLTIGEIWAARKELAAKL